MPSSNIIMFTSCEVLARNTWLPCSKRNKQNSFQSFFLYFLLVLVAAHAVVSSHTKCLMTRRINANVYSIHIYDVLVALERKSDDFSHIEYIHHTTHKSVPVPIHCTSAAEKRYLSIYIHCVNCCTHCIVCELHSECHDGWTPSLQVSLCISPMPRTPALL